MRQTKALLAIITLLLLAACGKPAQTAPTPAANAPTAVGAYPAPAGAYPAPTISSAYPAPADTQIISSEPLVIPQPASDQVGVIHGVLQRITESNPREPIAGGILFLGVLINRENGDPIMVELDKNIAPYAQSNVFGEFAFNNVPPGRYGLMYETAEGAVLLNNPTTGADMIIEVIGGKILDLGEMAYPLP